jgi:hypothetical protein
MFNNLVRQINPSSEFNELETRFASAIVSSNGDVRFHIGDGALGSVLGLSDDRFEEEVHVGDESLCRARPGCLEEPTKESVQLGGVMVRRWCKRKEGGGLTISP